MKFAEALDKTLALLRRLRFYEVMLFLFLAMIIGAWSVKEITESALFCGNTCHVMRPHYRDWETSSHREVPCVQCHLPPDDQQQFVPSFRALAQVAGYMTRSHKAGDTAEVPDTACLTIDCHSRRLLDGRVRFSSDILFDHSPHLRKLRRGKILRCTTCHSQVAMGQHITVTIDACFICHFKEGPSWEETSDCGLCHTSIGGSFGHEPFLARGADCNGCHEMVVRGQGDVPPESCDQCHGESDAGLTATSTEVLHRLHITDQSVDCTRCHAPIRHSKPQAGKADLTECTTCHENRHAGISLLYQGTGARGVPDAPSPMFLKGVSCRACHIVPDSPPAGTSIYSGTTLLTIDAACDKCHDKVLSSSLRSLTEQVRREVVNSQLLLQRLQRSLDRAGDAGIPPETKRVFDNARHNILFVKASAPIHNPEYAIRVLDHSNRELERVLASLEQR